MGLALIQVLKNLFVVIERMIKMKSLTGLGLGCIIGEACINGGETKEVRIIIEDAMDAVKGLGEMMKK